MDSVQLNKLIQAINSVTTTVINGGGGISNKVPYTGATANVNLGAFGLTTNTLSIAAGTTAKAPINLAAGVAPTTPQNGDIWYSTSGTNGFRFYSRDVSNTSDIVEFTNGTNTIQFYVTTATDAYVTASPGCNLTWAVNNGAIQNYLMDSNGNQSWTTAATSANAVKPFTWTAGANTNKTASTEANIFLFTTGGNTLQYATGALAINRTARLTNQVVSFVGASTITDGATFSIDGAQRAGANATITTSYGILVQSQSVSSGGSVTTAYGAFINAPSGATTNYGLGVQGNLQVLGNIVTDTTNGIKIGTSTSQKLSFYNATPVVQQTTAIVGAAFAANTSGLGDGSATYGGYTGGQIVAALKLYGILA